MKTKNILACLFLTTCVLSSGCISMFYSYGTIPENRGFPKKPNFSIFPQEQQRDGLIDFSAVYVKEDFRILPDGGVKYFYNFMRFWPSGHVYMRASDHIPLLTEAESFYSAYVGFYTIEGTNIIYETYVPMWDYIKTWGTISENAIHMHAVERRDLRGKEWRYPKDYTHIRHHIEGLEREPDWSYLPLTKKDWVPDEWIIKRLLKKGNDKKTDNYVNVN